MFKDRRDAGDQLADALEIYRGRDAVVLAIPRGGVEVGDRVARRLGVPLAPIVARKLPFPHNPEAGFGAIAEDGSVFLIDDAIRLLGNPLVDQILDQQQREAQRRVRVLRRGKPLPDIKGKTVILVDDGIAIGSTMRAGIRMCRNRDAAAIVAAAPVSSGHAKDEIAEEVDAIVVIETPPLFRAVAEVYRNWYDVSDEETIQILDRWEQECGGPA